MTRMTTAAHAALLAALLFAPASHAVMYKWTDETGSVTYSNVPPADPEKARDVTTIEDISPATSAAGLPPAYGSTTDDARRPAAAAPPRVSTRRLRAEAVQDPCLRSPDPQCHQRNRDKYDPYLGYAPSTLAPPAVGSTASSGGSGEFGGRITITPGR